MNKTIQILLGTVFSLTLLYVILLIPDQPDPPAIKALEKPFIWNQNEQWPAQVEHPSDQRCKDPESKGIRNTLGEGVPGKRRVALAVRNRNSATINIDECDEHQRDRDDQGTGPQSYARIPSLQKRIGAIQQCGDQRRLFIQMITAGHTQDRVS